MQYTAVYSNTTCIFTARRIASAVSAIIILSVRPSVRLSVACVFCDKIKELTANILISLSYKRALYSL